jgi:hypothetical protein
MHYVLTSAPPHSARVRSSHRTPHVPAQPWTCSYEASDTTAFTHLAPEKKHLLKYHATVRFFNTSEVMLQDTSGD